MNPYSKDRVRVLGAVDRGEPRAEVVWVFVPPQGRHQTGTVQKTRFGVFTRSKPTALSIMGIGSSGTPKRLIYGAYARGGG